MKMQKIKSVVDERSNRKLEETATGVLGLFYVVCTIEMIIKIIITHEYLSALGELIILLSVTFTFLIVQRLDKNYSPTLPRKNNSEELSAEETRKSRLKRMLIYAKESIISAIGFTIFSVAMDYFLKKQNITWNLDFFISQLGYIIIASIVFFIADTILKERRIKKYNKWNEKLDKYGDSMFYKKKLKNFTKGSDERTVEMTGRSASITLIIGVGIFLTDVS